MKISRAGIYSISYYFNYVNSTSDTKVALYIDEVRQDETILKIATGNGQLSYTGIFEINVWDKVQLRNENASANIELADDSVAYSMTVNFIEFIPDIP